MFKKQISEHKFRRVWESTPKEDISYKYLIGVGIYQISVTRGNFRYVQQWHPITDSRKCFRFDCSKLASILERS